MQAPNLNGCISYSNERFLSVSVSLSWVCARAFMQDYESKSALKFLVERSADYFLLVAHFSLLNRHVANDLGYVKSCTNRMSRMTRFSCPVAVQIIDSSL